MKKNLIVALLLCFCFSCAKIQSQRAKLNTITGETLYTGYNLWFEDPWSMRSINYKRGAMIPAGTRVKKMSRGTGYYIIFTLEGYDHRFVIEFTPKFHPRLTINAFKSRLFTPKSFTQLTRGLTEKEIKSIKTGILNNEMSKRAVLIAYGYPPEHETFSTEDDTWTYWMSRFGTKTIHFNPSKKP